jgi:hypothetical protein
MPEANVIVRKPLHVRERSRRTLDQRLVLCFPRLANPYARLIASLQPASRLRQAAVWRNARLSLEAFNRRDVEVLLLGRRPDWEFHPAREVVEAGLVEPCYRGSAGYRQYLSSWFEAWGANARVQPTDSSTWGSAWCCSQTRPQAVRRAVCRSPRSTHGSSP